MDAPFDWQLPDTLSFDTLQTTSLKSDLFLKIHHLEQISKELDRFLLLPKDTRQTVVKEYAVYFDDLLEQLVQDSGLVLEAVQGDSQEVELSLQYMDQLKSVMSAVTSILSSRAQLKT